MANPEHVRIFKSGINAWNEWRRRNPGIRPDLTNADLRWACFSGRDLSGIFLSSRLADLSSADLSGANMSEAKLEGADLSCANLIEVDLRSAVLARANLREACLRRALLLNANLEKANLNRAELSQANIRKGGLLQTNLREADLREANLSEANISDADLIRADLRYSTLGRADLTYTDLTGCRLFGTSRDDWNIEGVKCQYVYWDAEGRQRSPRDRDLEPGEFERLYAALPTIEYIFEHGMSPLDSLIMDRVVQVIRARKPKFDIKIDSINARGLAPSIKFTVQHEEHKESALEEVGKEYETKIRKLEDDKERLYQLLGLAIDKGGDVKLITAGPGAIVATDASTVNIQQHIHNALELQKAISEEPEKSKSFAKVAKKTALDIIGGAIKDIAKGQVKEAAKQIIELGKDLGPVIAKTAAYAFFSSM